MKYEKYEQKIIQEMGCNYTTGRVDNYRRKEEEYDPQADFFG